MKFSDIQIGSEFIFEKNVFCKLDEQTAKCAKHAVETHFKGDEKIMFSRGTILKDVKAATGLAELQDFRQ